MLTRRTPLQSFLAVVDCSTVHEAARRLNLSQPTITRQIKNLEEELGGDLFARGVRGMELTRFGERFLVYARQVDQTWRYALTELNGITSGQTGSLGIGAGPAWAYTLVPDAVADLQQLYPELSVRIVTRMSEYYRMIETGELDVLVAELPDERLPGLRYESLLRIERLVFAGHHHPLAGRSDLTAADLVSYPWIVYLDSVYGPTAFAAYFQAEGLSAPEPAVATSTFQSGFRLMQQGDYLMMLPGTIRANEEEWRIRPLRITGKVRDYAAGVIYRPEFLRIQPYAAFRELLIARCRHRGLSVLGDLMPGPHPARD